MREDLILKLIEVIRQLADADKRPTRFDRWLVPPMHDLRRELSAKMTDEEKEEVRRRLEEGLRKHV